MASMLGCLSILYVLPFAVFHGIKTEETDPNSRNKSTKKGSENQMSQLSLYRKVFKQKRLEQMNAVENILKMKRYEQQYKIVRIIFEKLFKVLQDAKVQIIECGYIPGEEFPPEQKHKEAIGNIVENTAFLGDIVLRLPDIARKIFSKDKEWELLALWSLSFTNSTTIYDEMDRKLLNLMAQELRLIPREPTYFNPFTEEAKLLKSKLQEETTLAAKGKKKAKKKKKSKGPRLSHIEL